MNLDDFDSLLLDKDTSKDLKPKEEGKVKTESAGIKMPFSSFSKPIAAEV